MRLAKLLFIMASMTPITLTIQTGCQIISSQKQAVYTIKAAGYAGIAVIDTAWQLRKEGKITEAQWQAVSDFYDHKFQPAFRKAMEKVKSDVNATAPVEVVSLLEQLKSIIK